MSKTRNIAPSGKWEISARNVWIMSLPMVAVCLMAAFFGATLAEAAKKKATKEICITFDELPVATSFGKVDHQKVTADLLAALKKHEVKAAGFVVGKNINGQHDLLGAWLNDGHVLGSLTNSNQDLHLLAVESFIRDVAAGQAAMEPMLSGFGQEWRYFRYPFLHYGNTVEAKREVRRYLAANDMVIAHATVVVEDYLYNLAMEKLGEEIDSSDYFNLRSDYLEHVLDAVEQAEADATQVLKRRCRHILQLRANLLNAEYLDDLLTMLEEQGYRFIALDRALDDELYFAPEAYFGARGVGYIQMIRDSDSDLLPAE
jgi:peptidoglycan/xylan/chitin deacetylase (PgdA/CDA1 family)